MFEISDNLALKLILKTIQMKKVGFILFLVVIINCNSYGQWYNKKYHVSDIDLLSVDQLQKSLKDSKNSSLSSIGVAGLGGLLILGGANQWFELPDHPTLLEELLGKKGMNDIAYVVGVGMVAGGIIASIGFESRAGKIKSALSKNGATGSIRISPMILSNHSSRSRLPGLLLTYRF